MTIFGPLDVEHAHANGVLLAHLVWTTKRREPWLDEALDAPLARLLERKAAELRARVVAVGNAADHVHVLVRYPQNVHLSTIAHRLKGASSHDLHQSRLLPRRHRWQTGYWFQSIDPWACSGLVAYIRDQRAHHRDPDLLERWQLGPEHPFSLEAPCAATTRPNGRV